MRSGTTTSITLYTRQYPVNVRAITAISVRWSALATTLRHGFFHAGTYSSFRGRVHGKPNRHRTLRASSLVAYTTTHDQIGNRAIGDRPGAYLTPGQVAIKAALILLSPYTPMLFMGEEWNASTPFQFFTSHPEPELGKATAEGRKAEFAEHGWDSKDIPDPQDPATFERSKLDWSSSRPHRTHGCSTCYRASAGAAARIASRSPTRGSRAPDVDYDEDERWFLLDRAGVRLLCNLSPTRSSCLPGEHPFCGGTLSSRTRSASTTTVPGHSFVVLT